MSISRKRAERFKCGLQATRSTSSFLDSVELVSFAPLPADVTGVDYNSRVKESAITESTMGRADSNPRGALTAFHRRLKALKRGTSPACHRQLPGEFRAQ